MEWPIKNIGFGVIPNGNLEILGRERVGVLVGRGEFFQIYGFSFQILDIRDHEVLIVSSLELREVHFGTNKEGDEDFALQTLRIRVSVGNERAGLGFLLRNCEGTKPNLSMVFLDTTCCFQSVAKRREWNG